MHPVIGEAMTWTKQPAIEGGASQCTVCGCGAHSDLEMDRHIAVGFGAAGYTRDCEEMWRETGEEEREYPTVGDVEKIAAADPDHDWRIYFFAPLYEAVYQRHGEGSWALISKGDGFA